jgi:hypothetical protein
LVAARTERLTGFSPFAYALSPFIQVICRGLRLLPEDANPVHDSTSWRDDGTTGDYRSVGPCAPGTVDTARANDRVCFAYDAECRQDDQKCSGNFDHCQLLFPEKYAWSNAPTCNFLVKNRDVSRSTGISMPLVY